MAADDPFVGSFCIPAQSKWPGYRCVCETLGANKSASEKCKELTKAFDELGDQCGWFIQLSNVSDSGRRSKKGQSQKKQKRRDRILTLLNISEAGSDKRSSDSCADSTKKAATQSASKEPQAWKTVCGFASLPPEHHSTCCRQHGRRRHVQIARNNFTQFCKGSCWEWLC